MRLPQFTYTKFVVVVDKHINVRDPRQVVWAIAAQVDPQRDLFVLENTPFDTLDFASEQLGLGGRMAIDATTKIGPEKNHEWGEPSEPTSGLRAKSIRTGSRSLACQIWIMLNQILHSLVMSWTSLFPSSLGHKTNRFFVVATQLRNSNSIRSEFRHSFEVR